MSCKCNCGEGGPGERVDFQYAVKMICGIIKPSAQSRDPLPPGRYSTATNVHNPSRCDTVILRWKVAIGLPGLKVGPVSTFAEASLGPDEALEIDCSDVVERLKRDGVPMPSYLKGWVIIECSAQLDVVAVYGTAVAGGEAPVNAFHTERVEPRCLPVCDDFGLDISTGVADWYVKGPGTGAGFAQATLSSPTSPWAAPFGGSLWVIPGTLKSDGEYTYRLPFKLCSGFRNPILRVQFLADYFANVFLNGHQISPHHTAAPDFSSATFFTNSNHFKAGDNELTVIVNNTERLSSTGLDLQGWILAENGRCPGVPYPLLGCPRIGYDLHTRELYMNFFGGGAIDNDLGTSSAENGVELGDTGGKIRAEEFGAALQGVIPPGTSLEYQVFTRSVSGTTAWSKWTQSGMAGNSGKDQAITALQIRLVNAPFHCHVKYSVATRPSLGIFVPNSVKWGPDIYDDTGIAGDTGPSWWAGDFAPIVAVRVEIVYF
ncbi:MAG: hypothetical protein WAO00_15955 [Chthoniobacterales bacterium]